MERDVTTTPRNDPTTTLHAARLREYQTLLGIILIIAFAAWGRSAWRSHSLATPCLAAAVLAYLPVSNLLSLNANRRRALALCSRRVFIPGCIDRDRRIRATNDTRSADCGLLNSRDLDGRARGAHRGANTAAWHDQRTFFESTIAHGGDTPRMHINLGNLDSAAGKP